METQKTLNSQKDLEKEKQFQRYQVALILNYTTKLQ